MFAKKYISMDNNISTFTKKYMRENIINIFLKEKRTKRIKIILSTCSLFIAIVLNLTFSFNIFVLFFSIFSLGVFIGSLIGHFSLRSVKLPSDMVSDKGNYIFHSIEDLVVVRYYFVKSLNTKSYLVSQIIYDNKLSLTIQLGEYITDSFLMCYFRDQTKPESGYTMSKMSTLVTLMILAKDDNVKSKIYMEELYDSLSKEENNDNQ